MFPVLCEDLFDQHLFFFDYLSGPDEVCPRRFGFSVPMAFAGGGPCLFLCKIWYFAFPFGTSGVPVEGASGDKSGDWFISPFGLYSPGPFLVFDGGWRCLCWVVLVGGGRAVGVDVVGL